MFVLHKKAVSTMGKKRLYKESIQFNFSFVAHFALGSLLVIDREQQHAF